MPQNQLKYDLTIGMIVKNEIKYLRRCLETLAPLREALSCELIITDTGSTDGTKEVAQEFADVYLEFEWCNDFAKARNTGVEIAQGRWFFYVDADNHFDESILEIATFLKQPKVDQNYDHANFTIRSYTDTEDNLSVYTDTQKAWLVNFSQGRRLFHYSIHETIFIDGSKSGSIPTIMHHWGYLKEGMAEKKARNFPLLQALVKQSPKDLKARYQLLVELSDPKETKRLFEESIKIGRPLAKQTEECQIWVMLLQMHYFGHLRMQKEFTTLDKLLPTWIDYIPNSVFTLHFLGFYLDHTFSQSKENSILLQENFTTYQTLFHQLQANPQDKYLGFNSFYYASLLHYAKLESSILQRALFSQTKDWAKERLTHATGYTFLSAEGKHPYTMAYCNFAFLLEDYHFLTDLVNFIQREGQEKEQTVLQDAIVQKFQTFSPPEQQAFLQSFHPNQDFSSLLQPTPPAEHTSFPDVSTIKETLLALLMEKRLEEARSLFLLLEQAAPHDPSVTSLKPLFSSTL